MKMLATRGFTIIELMIALAVVGILFAVGFPSMSAWLQNSNIRAAAEGGLNGMQLARAEAVRRNAGVQLAFDANGGWTANVVAGGEVIQARPSGEGSVLLSATVPSLERVFGSRRTFHGPFPSRTKRTD